MGKKIYFRSYQNSRPAHRLFRGPKPQDTNADSQGTPPNRTGSAYKPNNATRNGAAEQK